MSIQNLARRRSPAEWRAMLNAARSEEDVIAVVRTFLSSLTHFEWALVGARPEAVNIDSATRLAEVSYDMMRMTPAHEAQAELVVANVVGFLSDAVARIAHLGNPRNSENP